MVSKYSNVSDVPLALAVFLANDTYSGIQEADPPFTISATTLLKPLRQIILTPRLSTSMAQISLPDMMANRLGQAIHSAFEKAWLQDHQKAMAALGYPQKVIDRVLVNPSPEELLKRPDAIPVYLEQRVYQKVGKWTVTGQFDFVGEGRVQDLKTTSVWTWQRQVNAEKYALQGSIYRWLNPKIITDNQMDIIYVFMDWKAGMVRTDPNYPPQRFKKQTFDLLSWQLTNSFIHSKLREIEAHWDTDESELPHCNDEELWRSEPVFKYYKNPLKTSRSTKNFATEREALMRLVEDGSVGQIIKSPGQVTACKYCSAFALCSQKDQLIASGDLVL